VQAIERRIATATPPNRLTTQRRLLQRAGGDAWGVAMKGSGSKANLSLAKDADHKLTMKANGK
jgi:hypothetical protein